MTPEEARDLVASFEGRRLAADYETYGLADGYQHIEHYVLLEIDGEHPETGEPDVWTDTLGVPDKATADMLAAAPTLAAMIAGMTCEYAVEMYHEAAGVWIRCTDWVGVREVVEQRLSDDDRIVRRYVTEPEVIE